LGTFGHTLVLGLVLVKLLLQNPLLLKLLVATFLVLLAVLVGMVAMRSLRTNLTYKPEPEKVANADHPLFNLATYNAVIQQMREQEKELKLLRQQERDSAAASENISEAVLSNLSSGVVFFDRAGTVRQVNNAAKSILGYASPWGFHIRDLFRGMSEVRWTDGSASNSAARFVSEMERTMREGSPFQRVEAEYCTPAGERRVLGVGASAVRSKKGDILGVSCLIADLTQITELSRQVRLRENLASLGEMSAGIAHEFKNSLATISGYAQMLVKDASASSSGGFAAKIAQETEALARIVTEFLDFARPHSVARQTVDLHAILQDCAQETGIDLHVPAAPPLRVAGDSVLLRQAISNLLRNSAEAAANGRPVQVSVTGMIEANKLQLKLADNGHGIPAEDLPKIFIPFFTTKASGTGLGLALVHRIITEHGGSITVDSGSEGTTVTMTLSAATAVSGAEA